MKALWLVVAAFAVSLVATAANPSDTIFANGFEVPCGAPPYPTRQFLVGVAYSTKGRGVAQTADEAFRLSPLAPVVPFPWIGNRSNTFSLQTSQYVAFPFTVPNNLSPTWAGRFSAFDTNYMGFPPFPELNGISYSVSTCPGDFTVEDACKAQWSGQDGAPITIVSPEIPDPTHALCKLQRNRTFYLSIISATILAPNIPACLGVNCAASISYFPVGQ